MVWAVLLGLLSTSLFNIGMAIQKTGATAWDDGFRRAFEPRHRPALGRFVGGTCLNGIGVGAQVVALHYGPATVVALTTGFGLVVLAVYARLVLHEVITRQEWLGIVLIVLGVTVAGYAGAAAPLDGHVHLMAFWVCGSIVVAGAGLPALMTYRKEPPTGLWLAILSGCMSGLTVIVLRLQAVTGNVVWPAVGWCVLTFLSLLLNQLAYRRGKAVEIIPTFTAATIVAPFVVAPWVLEEPTTAVMWLGTAVLLVGVGLLGTGKQAVR